MSMVAERAELRSRRLDPVPEPWRRRVALLKVENAALRDRGQHLEREQRRLRGEQRQLRERIEGLEAERDRLGAEAERLERVNARLREQVERLRREAKRQAAPFSRDDPKPDPKRSGRKPGAAHGRHAHRQPPAPEQVDRVVAVGLPAGCPGCGGELALERVAADHGQARTPCGPPHPAGGAGAPRRPRSGHDRRGRARRRG